MSSGVRAFLRRYGFGPAHRYFILDNGREYDSKAVVGAAYGYQHPDEGPLTASAFSGGEPTVKATLERLGYTVIERQQDRLAGLFEGVCEQLQLRAGASPDFSLPTLNTLVQAEIPRRLQQVVGDRAQTRGRTGVGTLADVPWVGLFPPDAQASAKLGFYLVYLFSKDGKVIYLSLIQGTENVKRLEVLVKRSIDLRCVIGPEEGLLTQIDLRSTADRPRKYEAATAYAVRYESGALPEDEVLVRDLERMLSLLQRGRLSGLSWLEDEPLHLVFKWRYEREPRTIEHHRAVADERGSVWWGRFSASPTPSVNEKKLEQIRQQLSTRTPTHAYIYRRGELWRTTAHDISTSPPSVDDPRFPSYYRPEDCNLFVRVSDFEHLDPSWLPDHAVLASHPDPDPSRLAGALGNQTTPLFIFEMLSSAQPSTPGARDQEQREAIPQEHATEEIDILGITMAEVCDEVAVRLREAGLDYGTRHDPFVRAALVSLATKRFLLLTGLSGSGKTRLGVAIGEWFGDDRVAVIPVRPDWTGPDALLGFENGLSLAVRGRHAWTAPEALRFILTAYRDPDNPYLLVLDEMNLAHVERYFADVLSGMESGQGVVPNVALENDEWRTLDPDKVPFPTNLFVVGTVNIDETTYMFSPKVLDRANTLEFRVATDDLRANAEQPKSILPGTPAFVRRSLHAATTSADDDWDGRSQMAEWLRSLHTMLLGHDREFAHRVFFEALRFGALLSEAGEPQVEAALDLQVLQKVLPRFHGSVRQVSTALSAVGGWCFHGPASPSGASFDPLSPPDGIAALPLSYEKIQRMTRRLRDNQFVAFAE
jgi:MoxR-like ATPase